MSEETIRRQMDSRFSRMGSPEIFARPVKGWVYSLRRALGMTTMQLAKRLGLSQSRVVAIEQHEVSKNIKLSTLERVAEALGCRLVYALVPNESLQTVVRRKATEKAQRMLAQAAHTMGLEDQATSQEEQQAQLESLVLELLRKPHGKLWDED